MLAAAIEQMAPPLAHSLTAPDMTGRTNSGYMMEIQD